MGDKKIQSLIIIQANIGGTEIVFHIVVIEYRRIPCVGKLSHPWVGQGKPHHIGTHVAVLEHIDIIGMCFLEFRRQSHKIHLVSGRFCRFFEPQDNFIAKIIGDIIIHIFDENTELFEFILFLTFQGIAHLHGRFQNGFSHCFANIWSIVQRFGDCAFCNA